jgi:hypothetical protein
MAATKGSRCLKKEGKFVHPIKLKEGLTRLPKMWGKSQDENDLDWQGQAKKVLSPMQNFCFIR